MSLPDEVIGDFFTLATNLDRAEVARIIEGLAAGKLNPMEEKKRLARTIATEFWGEEAAREAEATFERTVQRKEIPEDIPNYLVAGDEALIEVIVEAGLAPSKREARRLFEQGAVSIDGKPAGIDVVARPGIVVQVGKRRWLRLEQRS
jgi:tyrosyl-tRNA synthetase